MVSHNDFVFKDGAFVGAFEDMYQSVGDPWGQKQEAYSEVSQKCLDAISEIGYRRVLDFGSGLGHFTQRMKLITPPPNVLGIEISQSAVDEARKNYPEIAFQVGQFPALDVLSSFKPNLIVMNEISWYVPDKLEEFLAYVRRHLPATHLLHKLTTYPDGVQRFGTDFFTNSDEILKYFQMSYIDYGQKETSGHWKTWFLGTFADKKEE